MALAKWIVSGTSMVIEAETEQEAIGRAQESSGWSWEARKAVYAPGEQLVARWWADELLAAAGREMRDDDRGSVYAVEEDLPAERFMLAGNGPDTIWATVVRDQDNEPLLVVVSAYGMDGAGSAVLHGRDAEAVAARLGAIVDAD